MSAWSQVDELRKAVASKLPVEVDDAATLEEAQVALKKSHFVPERLVVMGWEILLSRRKQGGLVLWHLSAMLHPHGRSSTKHDWEVVGKIAARVGAPRDPVLVPENPSAATHWSWTEH